MNLKSKVKLSLLLWLVMRMLKIIIVVVVVERPQFSEQCLNLVVADYSLSS